MATANQTWCLGTRSWSPMLVRGLVQQVLAVQHTGTFWNSFSARAAYVGGWAMMVRQDVVGEVGLR